MTRNRSRLLLSVSLLACAFLLFASCKRQPDRLEQALAHIESPLPDDRLTGFHDLADLLNASQPSVALASRHEQRILSAYDARSSALHSAQRTAPAVCGAWTEQEPYRRLRYEAELLLDLLGALRTPAAEQRLRDALVLTDPRLQFFAVQGLLRMGIAVDGAVVARVADDDEMRNLLFDVLQETGRSSVFPEALRTQEAFARSDLVRWLTSPIELGCVPTDLELAKRVATDRGDFFVFRFKGAKLEPDASADGSVWRAAMAGPWPRSLQPSSRSGEQTFSDYVPWDALTPEAHVERMMRALVGADAASR